MSNAKLIKKLPNDSAIKVTFHGFKSLAFSGRGYACPTSSDTTVSGLKSMELRRKSNVRGLNSMAFSGRGYACPTSLDTSSHGLTPTELRRNIIGEPDFIFTQESKKTETIDL